MFKSKAFKQVTAQGNTKGTLEKRKNKKKNKKTNCEDGIRTTWHTK